MKFRKRNFCIKGCRLNVMCSRRGGYHPPVCKAFQKSYAKSELIIVFLVISD